MLDLYPFGILCSFVEMIHTCTALDPRLCLGMRSKDQFQMKILIQIVIGIREVKHIKGNTKVHHLTLILLPLQFSVKSRI